ncbi:type II toxin-antitoxin system VapC family toxin [Methylopila turkensis]|uniref:Ribonuclease VapC n=1 Tax=Methylopila turkensis TaxID=1437816 RepID=A0A9W6N6V1_9HYPH|nr:type II toxin-antitoxin system VapC family toxin [Methylopila turkensis]GLK79692.1 ribonuclease VapC [Methylopila turkensis]
MFVDASALVAILVSESDGDELERRLLETSSTAITSPLAIFETTLAVSTRRALTFAAAEIPVLGYLKAIGVETIPVTAEIGRLAVAARARYGKGTGHPARLNMGDCFAYACAQAHAVPLLYKGDDFVHTDLA